MGFLEQSFSQYCNLGLHSQICWAVSKTLVGVLVWSLFMYFLLPVTFRCFLFLILSYLKPTYMSLFFNAENSSQGFSRTICWWTELHIFFLKIHFTSTWFLHVISVLYHFFGKINTLTSGLLLYSYTCSWHMLELQRALCCSGITALSTCRMMFCVSSGGCIWNLFLQALMMVMSMTQSRLQRPFGEDITSWTLKSSSCSTII